MGASRQLMRVIRMHHVSTAHQSASPGALPHRRQMMAVHGHPAPPKRISCRRHVLIGPGILLNHQCRRVGQTRRATGWKRETSPELVVLQCGPTCPASSLSIIKRSLPFRSVSSRTPNTNQLHEPITCYRRLSVRPAISWHGRLSYKQQTPYLPPHGNTAGSSNILLGDQK